MDDLNADRMCYLSHSLAQSTQATYSSGWSSYTSFCSRFSYTPLPLSQEVLELYVSALARRLSFSTIKVYLHAVQHFSITQGYVEKINTMSRLYYVLRGIKIVLGSSRSRPRRLPITISQIQHLHRWLQLTFSSTDAIMLQAATSVAFFGLLRSSEYCSPRRSTPSTGTLALSDVAFKNGLLLVHLRHSKTDPFYKGCTIRIGPSLSTVCPVAAMRRFLSLRGPASGPLFTFQDGSLLTRTVMSNLLATCFPGSSLDTHSFRIGGASALSSGGLPDATVQILGRWTSNCFQRYLHFSDAAVCDAMLRMVHGRGNNEEKIWDSSWLMSRPW